MRRFLGSNFEWLLALSSLAMACHGCGRVGSAPHERVGRPATNVEDPVEVLIPVDPREEGALALDLNEDAMTGKLAPAADLQVRLAFGAEYPDTMSLALSSTLFFAKSAPVAATAFALESVTAVGDEPGVEASVGGDHQLRLTVHEAGVHLLKLELAAEFGEAARRATYTFLVTVEARQVAGAEWSTCSDPVYVVSGSPPSSSRLFPLDESGVVFEPANTSFDRGADIIVRAVAGTVIEAPAGIDSLTITGPSQTVQLRSNYGEVASIHLIQPGEIDGIQPTFYSDQGGARGGGIGLISGGTIAVDLSKSPYISVFPGARFGKAPVCSGPDAALFQLSSLTPTVCAIQPDGCKIRGCLTRWYAPAVATMVATGHCELVLEAVKLDHGAGLTKHFSVDIEAL